MIIKTIYIESEFKTLEQLDKMTTERLYNLMKLYRENNYMYEKDLNMKKLKEQYFNKIKLVLSTREHIKRKKKAGTKNYIQREYQKRFKLLLKELKLPKNHPSFIKAWKDEFNKLRKYYKYTHIVTGKYTDYLK